MRGVVDMKKQTKRKIRIICMAVIGILSLNSSFAHALALPYDTYNYNFYKETVATPAAYIPHESISSTELIYEGNQLGKLNNPQDLCKTPDGNIVIADTGNNRIVILNKTMTKVEKIITGFEQDGEYHTFSAPYGVSVSEKYEIYVANSQNNQIVVLDRDGTLIKLIENPVSEVLEDDYVFVPLKVAVDYADRVYCIAQNMFEGIMVFENDGSFIGFFGTIEVKISLWEKFWKKIATKEERSNQKLFIPTEFTGMDIDKEGFLYTSNITTDGVQALRRLNPKGQDVIKKGKNKNLGGDLRINGFSQYAGPSQIVDVVYRDKGMYSMLDRKRGRVFTYDHEGNLLYIFGGLGSQKGTFMTPIAVEHIEDRIIVLDSYRAEVLTFVETEYGNLINTAVALRYDGDEIQAVDLWKRVLELDENNELAYVGIGKAYLTAGENKKAMEYLKRGMNREFYSIAFRRYRNGVLKENMNGILSGTSIVLVLMLAGKKLAGKKVIWKKRIRYNIHGVKGGRES